MAVTAPCKVLGTFHHLGSNGVQVDVTTESPAIRFILREDRLESTLVQRTHAPMAAIEHGVSQDDFEQVFIKPWSKGISRSSGLPAAWGYATDGRYLMVVYEDLDEMTILPVAA